MASHRSGGTQATVQRGIERLRALIPSPGPEMNLQGKVVLITGGSRGLGLLLGREFARQGCRLAICARDQEELEEARADLQAEGGQVFAHPCDVSQRAEVNALVASVTDHYGRIDMVVNNAGIITVGPLAAMTIGDFEVSMGVMFWGILYTTLAVLPQMRTRGGGSIVNITSIGGKISAPHLLPYSCAKFAAVGLSEGLRAELAQEGIAVTTIAPGLMRTGSYLNAFFKGIQEGEYTWFALGAALPFVSMDAERAAVQIVAAARRGEAERILSLPATLAARFHGLFPGLTADILGAVNHLLPPAEGTKTRASGKTVEEGMHADLLEMLTALGKAAARRFHE